MIASDKEIWDAIKNNDKKMFEVLFFRYYDSLCLYAQKIVRNEETAREITSQVFLKIWFSRDNIQITHGIKPYLFRSVFNACSDYLDQNKKKNQYLFLEIDERISEITSINEDYIFDYLQNEVVEKEVWNAIEQLPPHCREIFCLSRFEQLTYQEISARLNISVNTVKTQICRALDSLRNRLSNYI